MSLMLIRSASFVAAQCAIRMRKFHRCNSNGVNFTSHNLPISRADDLWIEYIPSVHDRCKPGCNDSTHTEF